MQDSLQVVPEKDGWPASYDRKRPGNMARLDIIFGLGSEKKRAERLKSGPEIDLETGIVSEMEVRRFQHDFEPDEIRMSFARTGSSQIKRGESE